MGRELTSSRCARDAAASRLSEKVHRACTMRLMSTPNSSDYVHSFIFALIKNLAWHSPFVMKKHRLVPVRGSRRPK